MYERFKRINDLLMCIDRRRKQIGESAMDALDILPSQHFVLVCLKHGGPTASQARLAEMMQVSPASVARSLKGLDRDGYISRLGGMDGRCNEITITPKGEQILSQSLALFQDLDARCYAGFEDSELDQLGSLLERLLSNLKQIKSETEGEIKK